jgi:hypothetical protein
VLRTYLRINRVGLVGAARLSPERTGKVGTAARPGSGDAVGRAAPDLMLVWCLLLESCRPGTASRRRGRRLGASRDRKRAAEQRGIGAWDDPKSQGGPTHRGHPVEIHTRAANMHFRN